MPKNTQDTSMDALAKAHDIRGEYVTEDGAKLHVRKVTVADYPLVLKVARAAIAYVQDIGEKDGSMTMMVASFFDVLEENMPLVIEVVGNVTNQTKEEVETLSLGDIFGLVSVIWETNKAFFMQTMAAIQSLNPSTPEPGLQPIANRAARRRAKKG